jgi:hypothetical protein
MLGALMLWSLGRKDADVASGAAFVSVGERAWRARRKARMPRYFWIGDGRNGLRRRRDAASFDLLCGRRRA